MSIRTRDKGLTSTESRRYLSGTQEIEESDILAKDGLQVEFPQFLGHAFTGITKANHADEVGSKHSDSYR
jgi:hypothetical protein